MQQSRLSRHCLFVLVCLAWPQVGFAEFLKNTKVIVLADKMCIYNLDSSSRQIVNKLFWRVRDNRSVRAIEKLDGFVLCGDFSSGRAVIAMMQGDEVRFGAIDATGAIRVSVQFQNLSDFHDGRARATTSDGDGIVDVDGRWVVQPGTYSDLGEYSEGLCTFTLGGQFGLLDLDGRIAVRPQFSTSPGPFNEGVGLVLDETQQAWVYLMKTGEALLSMSRRNIVAASLFHDSVARVQVETIEAKNKESRRLWGFIDIRGRFAIEPVYGSAGDFSESLAPVCQGVALHSAGLFHPNGDFSPLEEEPEETRGSQKSRQGEFGWGFINLRGELVIPMQFEEVRYFHEGLAAFRSGRHWGYVDRSGRVVIAPQFQSVHSFRNGYAAVHLADGTLAFIDPSGAVLVKIRGVLLQPFQGACDADRQ